MTTPDFGQLEEVVVPDLVVKYVHDAGAIVTDDRPGKGIVGGHMVAAGVAGFGVVVGWWAASLAGLRRPSRRAGGGMAAGLLSSAVLVVLLTGYGSLVAFGFGATVGAATRVVFLAIAARQHLSKGPP